MNIRALRSVFRPFLVLAMIAPFVVYLLLCQKFVQGGIAINVDTSACYVYTKYFYNNLLQGVMPMWEPFIHSGRPLVYWGMLNPFTTLVPAGVLSGLSFYQAFLVFILFYYFLGLLGFYFLSKIILKSPFFAYLSYVALTLSGLGLMVFNQWIILQIFVASVWFFLFLVRFFKEFKRRDFLGLCCSLFIMTISYYPFYLLTLVIVSAFFFCLYFRDCMKPVLAGTAKFFCNNKAYVLLGIFGLLLAFSPLLMYKSRDQAGDMIAPARHLKCTSQNVGQCYQSSEMTFFDVAYAGVLSERASIKTFFIGFPPYSYLSDDCFYVSIFCLLVILVAAVNSLGRLSKTLLWIWCVIFLIAMGGVTPVYGFFYNNFFYFKYFRNLFFFMAYLMPIMVLYFSLQLKELLGSYVLGNRPAMVWVAVVHILFAGFAFLQDEVLLSTYATIAASFLFFTSFYLGKRRLSEWIVFGLVALQPLQVYYLYVQDASRLGFDVPLYSEMIRLDFAYQRPADSRQGTNIIFRLRDFDFESLLKMTDSDGRFILMPYSVPKWYFSMMIGMGRSVVTKYIHNKFYLYDQWEFYHEQNPELWGNVQRSLNNLSGPVYLFAAGTTSQEKAISRVDGSGGAVEIIDKELPHLKVTSFTVNDLTLFYHVDSEKVLVYTDNYTNDWRAYIDGDPVQVYRANLSFKGVRLKPGDHVLNFRYEPKGGKGIYWLLYVFNLVMVVCVVFLFLWRVSLKDEAVPKMRTESLSDTSSRSMLNRMGVYYLVLGIMLAVLIDTQLQVRIKEAYLQGILHIYQSLDIN